MAVSATIRAEANRLKTARAKANKRAKTKVLSGPKPRKLRIRA